MEQKTDKRSEVALSNFKNGMNCSQSVVMAYADLLGADAETMFKVAEGFGRGMGGMQYVCGALTGAFMLIGLKNSSGSTEASTKAKTAKLVKEVAEKFCSINGSIMCSELKGGSGSKVVPCAECIATACRFVEECLSEGSSAE